MIRLRRRKEAVVPTLDGFARLAADIAQDRMVTAYADGLTAGFEIVLRLILGLPVEGKAEPYRGELPPELERWARDALARIEEER